MHRRDDFEEDLPIPEENTHLHWVPSKYETRCIECEKDIEIGDQILYNSKNREVLCQHCGEEIMG